MTSDDDQYGPDRHVSVSQELIATFVSVHIGKAEIYCLTASAVRVIPTRVGELVLVMRLPGCPGVARYNFLGGGGVGRCCLRTRRSPVASNFLLSKRTVSLSMNVLRKVHTVCPSQFISLLHNVLHNLHE